MDAKEYLKLIRQKAAEMDAENALIDWERRKNDWLRQIDKLYELVRAWLAPLSSDGTVKITTGWQPLAEQYIGSYDAPTLEIEIRKTKVTLTPRATLVIGSYGRVDLEGPAEKTLLVLVEDAENPKSIEHAHWHVVSQTSRTITSPLDADEFYSTFSTSIGIR